MFDTGLDKKLTVPWGQEQERRGKDSLWTLVVDAWRPENQKNNSSMIQKNKVLHRAYYYRVAYFENSKKNKEQCGQMFYFFLILVWDEPG